MANVVRHQLLTDAAYDRIKRAIITCELAPGQQIAEEQLGAIYAVGRAGVRAALKRLCQENFVLLASRKRYVVAPVTLKHVNELFELRLMLEPVAARRAAGHLPADIIERLRRLCDEQYVLGDHDSAARFLHANTEFHAAIAASSGNALVAEVIRSMLDKVERVHHMAHLLHDRNDLSRQEHFELLDALEYGEEDRAERLMSEQIQSSRAFVVDTMVASPRLQAAHVGLERHAQRAG